MTLRYFKNNPNAQAPVYSTKNSACFDLRACLVGERIVGFDRNNKDFHIPLSNRIMINPGERILIPTGLILDIPEGYSIRLHPRSGMALKLGVVLANSEGIVDEDYVEPTYMLVTNISNVPATINHGERIVQGELVKTIPVAFEELTTAPKQKTDRTGGMGHTGKQ